MHAGPTAVKRKLERELLENRSKQRKLGEQLSALSAR
jgi:hypothetical protein